MLGKKVKIVYSDNNESKVIKGILVEENEYNYVLETFNNNKIVIGKMFTIKLSLIDLKQ